MGQSSSQIQPSTQPSQHVAMPPPPRPTAKKRKKPPSPADSVTGVSTTASVQLARDLEQSAMEQYNRLEEPPRKRKKLVPIITHSKKLAQEMNNFKRSQEEGTDSTQVVAPKQPSTAVIDGKTIKSRKRKKKPQHEVAASDIDHGATHASQLPQQAYEPDNGNIEERVSSWVNSQDPYEERRSPNIRSEDSSSLLPGSNDQRATSNGVEGVVDNPATAKLAKKKDRKKKNQKEGKAENVGGHTSRPSWLESVPINSAGAFTEEERNIADRVFDDVVQDLDVDSVRLKEMIQDWKGIDSFISQLHAALPNRSRDSLRKFCKRRYHLNQRGPWTEEQDNDLRSAQNRFPDKWTEISKVVDRTAADCKDRWTKHLKFSQRNTGPWARNELIHLHNLAAICMEVIVDANERGELEKGVLADPDFYVQAINWNNIESRMKGIRSGHQCRQRFMKSWPGILASMKDQGFRSPFPKDEFIEEVNDNIKRNREIQRDDVATTSEKVKGSGASRSHGARAALDNFEIGDYLDVFNEIHCSFQDHAAEFDEATFWSIVGQKNVSRFSITWNGTALRRIALQTAIEEWPSKEKKLTKKLSKATTLQAKALVLANYVDKRTRKNQKIARTYKPELIGKTKEQILEIKRLAKKQHRISRSKPEKEHLSKDIVLDSDEDVDDEVPEVGTTAHADVENADNDVNGIEGEASRGRSGMETSCTTAPVASENHVDDSQSPGSDATESDSEADDAEDAVAPCEADVATQPDEPEDASDVSSDTGQESEEAENDSDNSDSEVDGMFDAESVPKSSASSPSESIGSDIITDRLVQEVDRDGDSSSDTEIPESEVGQEEWTEDDEDVARSRRIDGKIFDVNRQKSFDNAQLSKDEGHGAKSSAGDATSSDTASDSDDSGDESSSAGAPDSQVHDNTDTSDEASEDDDSSSESSEDEIPDALTEMAPPSTQRIPETQIEDCEYRAADATTDEITASSINSRYARSIPSGPGMSPDEFLRRCQNVGRTQHAQFTAINSPPAVKHTYGGRRKHR